VSVALALMIAAGLVAAMLGRQRVALRSQGTHETASGHAPWLAVLLAALAAGLATSIVGGVFLFGLNTTCTTTYDCTDNDCAPCRPLTNGTTAFIVGEAAFAALVTYAHSRLRERRHGWLVLVVGTLVGIGAAVAFLWWMVWWTGVNT
jgi:hypothetical protein